MKSKIRVFILTDSLGCPRKEINVNDTWVDKLLYARSGKNEVFYTYCKPGLQVNSLDIPYLSEYEPDIMICQFGIVDACRRALTNRELSLIRRFPFLRDWVNSFCKKHHYMMTKKREVHYTSLELFRDKIEDLIDSMPNTKIFFLEIAPPGPFLIDSVFSVEDDVRKYNDVLKYNSKGNAYFVELYNNSTKYLLDDGHHLNIFGNDIVYRKSVQIIEEWLHNEV